MNPKYTLISHKLCPYVQRAAIVLTEKGCIFERTDIDLSAKPGWFLKLSPLGKTPVLLVNDDAIFESAVICEYLDETVVPKLHPGDPLIRARHRAWIEFASSTLNDIAALYNAIDEQDLSSCMKKLQHKFGRIEESLDDAPYFQGAQFSLVDAAFAPVFRYFEVIDEILGTDILCPAPKVRLWRDELRKRPSVKEAVSIDYPRALTAFLAQRGSALSRHIPREETNRA